MSVRAVAAQRAGLSAIGRRGGLDRGPSDRLKSAAKPLLRGGLVLVGVALVYGLARRGGGVEEAVAPLALLVILGLCARNAWLAATWVLLAVVFPAEELPVNKTISIVPIAAAPFIVWLWRKWRARPIDARFVAVVGLAIWAALTWIMTTDRTRGGFVWLCVFEACVCGAGIVQLELDFELARVWVLRLGTALGFYAVIEGLVLHSNPLMGPLYAAASTPLVQHWASYRVTTLMGHPLVNGVGFAVVAILALESALNRRGDIVWVYFRLVLLVAALVETGSRGGIIAFAISSVVLVLFHRRWVRLTVGQMTSAIIVLGAFVALSGPLVARMDSTEGSGSVQARIELTSEVASSLHGRWLEGVGAGEAEASRRDPNAGGTVLPLESSYAELLVSMGVIGMLLLLAVVTPALWEALRSREKLAWGAGFLAFLIAIGGFNGVEGHPQLVVWLAGLLAMCGARPTRSGGLPGQPQPARPRVQLG